MNDESASPLAISALVCGVLGCVPCCTCVGYPLGVVFGLIEMKRINAGESSVAGRPLAKAGVIIGIAGSIVYGTGLFVFGILSALGRIQL